MTAYEAQRREQLRLVRYYSQKLSDQWDEDVHHRMQDGEWQARVLDSYQPGYDLVKVEAELVPLERTLHALSTIEGASPMFAAMLSRVRIALKNLKEHD